MENIKSCNPAINEDGLCDRHALASAIAAVASKDDATLSVRIDTSTDVVEMSDGVITALFNSVDVPCPEMLYFQLEWSEGINTLVHKIKSLTFLRWSTIQITKPDTSHLASVLVCADSLTTANHIVSLFLNTGDTVPTIYYSYDLGGPIRGKYVITDLDRELAKQFVLSCKHLNSASNQGLWCNYTRDYQHYMSTRHAFMQYGRMKEDAPDECATELLKNGAFGLGAGGDLPDLSPADLQAWLSAKCLIS